MSTRRAERSAEHTARGRALKHRPTPFLALLIVALGVVPAVGTALWVVSLVDPATGRLIIWVDATCATLGAAAALLVGMHIGKRIPLVYWHVAITVYAAGAAWGLTTAIGWPRWWMVVHGFGSLLGAGSWALYRLDAFRADPRENSDKPDTWGKVFGLVKTQIGATKATEHHVRADLTLGPGETLRDAQAAAERIESAAGTMRGRTLVSPHPDAPDDANRAQLSLMTSDPLATWPVWPGPSSPGGCFTLPTITGLYDDGVVERYWHAAGVDDQGDPRAAVHIGIMGMTRSGKTGERLVALVDGVLTRRNAVLVYADATKGRQSAAPLLGGVALYADTTVKARLLFARMKDLVRSRTELLGAHGYRDWTPAAYDDPELRLPAIVYHLDEADELIGNAAFVWLATKALSAGVFLSITLPRADWASMPTTARAAIGMWKCFGVQSADDAGFVLSDATVAAGARPENWRASRPGYHYLDGAPGVEERRYAMTCRSFRAEADQLAAAVAAGAAYRAQLAPSDLEALRGVDGAPNVLEVCAPTAACVQVAVPTGAVVDDEEDDVGSEYAVPPLEDGTREDEAAYAATDPHTPITPLAGPNVEFGGDGRPRAVSAEQAAAAFDTMLGEMADGKADGAVFDVAEFVARFPLRGESWMSRRLSAVASGEIVAPPGVTLERLDDGAGGWVRGRYVLRRLAPATSGNGHAG